MKVHLICMKTYFLFDKNQVKNKQVMQITSWNPSSNTRALSSSAT